MPKPISGALWMVSGGVIAALLDATHDGKFDMHGLHKVVVVGAVAGLAAWFRDQQSLMTPPPAVLKPQDPPAH